MVNNIYISTITLSFKLRQNLTKFKRKSCFLVIKMIYLVYQLIEGGEVDEYSIVRENI